jgi:hypothetical protein
MHTNYINKYKKLLRLCHYLIVFGGKLETRLSLFFDTNELLVPKPTRIETSVDSEEDFRLFEVFVKNHKN